MSLQEALEEDKKALAAMMAQESEETDEEEELEETEETEEVEEEEEVPEEKEPEKVEQPEKLDDAGYARLRREAAAAKKLAAEREAEIERLKNGDKESPVYTEDAIHPEIKEILEDRMRVKAEREFMSFENEFRAKVKDYDAVADHYNKVLYDSIRIQNPRKSPQEIAEMAKNTVLIKASQFMQQGYDPIEELYHEAISLGITGIKQDNSKEVEGKELKPDLNKLAENKKRSSGFAGASNRGSGSGQVTLKSAAEMTNEEWMKLSKEEKARLIGR